MDPMGIRQSYKLLMYIHTLVIEIYRTVFYLWKIWIPGFPNHLPQMHMYTNDVDYLDDVA